MNPNRKTPIWLRIARVARVTFDELSVQERFGVGMLMSVIGLSFFQLLLTGEIRVKGREGVRLADEPLGWNPYEGSAAVVYFVSFLFVVACTLVVALRETTLMKSLKLPESTPWICLALGGIFVVIARLLDN